MKARLIVLGRWILGVVFVYAGAMKLADPRLFATDLGHFHLLPYPLVAAIAVYLPWLEICCGSAVLWHRRHRGALLLLTALCAAFSLALASAWLRGLNIECGCFGRALAVSLPLALLRSLALGALSVGLLRSDQPKSPAGPAAQNQARAI